MESAPSGRGSVWARRGSVLALCLAAMFNAGQGDTPRVARFYSADSFWNRPVGANPAVDPHSVAMIKASIVPFAARSAFANGDDWGIALVHASASDKVYDVTCLQFYCNGPVTFRIPRGATPTTGSDHHLVVVDRKRELDMWNAVYDARNDAWSAGGRFVGDLYGWGANASPGTHAGGAVAAGFSGMGGVVRPEEIAQGHIDHALSVTIPHPHTGYVGPATATDGTNQDPLSIPEGAHLQLDPGYDVAAQAWPAWEKMLAKALQTYGAYVSDTGGTVAFYGQTDGNAGNEKWSTVGVPKNPYLASLPWNRMKVLDLRAVPSYPR